MTHNYSPGRHSTPVTAANFQLSAGGHGTGGSDISHLGDQLQSVIARQQSPTRLFEEMLRLLARQKNILAAVVLVRGPNQSLRCGPSCLSTSGIDISSLSPWLLAESHYTADASGAHVASWNGERPIVGIFAPLAVADHVTLVTLVDPGASGADVDREVAITQLFATYCHRWQEQRETARLSQQLSSTAAVLELVRQIESSEDLQSACFQVVAALQKHLSCERVVIGLRNRNGMCRVRAISGRAEIDENAELARNLQSVLNEAIVRDQVSAWPPLPGTPPHQLLAHKQLARRDASVISTPLRNAGGKPIGALAVEGRRDLAAIAMIPNFVAVLDEALGSALHVAQRAEGNRLERAVRSILAPRNFQRRWFAAGLCAVFVALMLLPIDYKIRCRSVIEPVERRFCVAPYDGLLENTFAQPGDVVTQGQLLARMDGRETRWELAGTNAEKHRAAKQRDTHMANHETADALLSELEMKRLDSHSELLRFREENLDLKSGSNGIVLSGSLDRRENYPVSKGQVLYEIAPLHPLRVELAVPADEVNRVRPGMAAYIRLDGMESQIVGKVDKIRPRAEVRDETNVFIAEVQIDNVSGQVRPGIKGHGRIVSQPRSIGWIVFHRVWERAQAAWPW